MNSNLRAPSDIETLVAQLLSRIATILLRMGLDSPRAEGLLRRAFVAAAVKKTRSVDRRATQSLLASLAGLSRLEVRTILDGRTSRLPNKSNRIDRLISGWRSDPQFLDSHGKPRPLQLRGAGASFSRLVRKYGRDVTVRSLQDELLRRGVVIENNSRLVLLQERSTRSSEAVAALSDLKFLVSHLEAIDFELGRRTYVTRQSSISAEGSKGVAMMKRIALERLDTVLNSLAETSADTRPARAHGKNRRTRRLLIKIIVASESEDGNP